MILPKKNINSNLISQISQGVNVYLESDYCVSVKQLKNSEIYAPHWEAANNLGN